jgi:NodT family efflux transporter outer membrane factor (OMF) lipoprotein
MTKRTAIKGAIVTATTTALLAGCTTIGPTTELETPSGTQFRNADGLTQRMDVPALGDAAQWWQATNDPELARLVEHALTVNLDIVAAKSRFDEANAFVKRVRAERFPAGDTGASAARQRQSLEGVPGAFIGDVPGFERDLTIYDVSTQANWEIDLFGRLGAATRAARANRAETSALLDGVRISIAAETADAYVTWAAANEQIAIIMRQCAIAEQLVETVRRRLAAGTATRTELDQIEGELARLDALLPQVQMAAEAQRNRLVVLTAGAELKSAPVAVPTIPRLSSLASPAVVLRARPDVRAAEARVAASDARIASALMEYYPSLSLAGLIGFQSIDSGQLFSSSAFNAQGLIGLRWRLFDFAKIDAEVKAARARSDGVLAGYQSALLLATEDVENCLFAAIARETQVREAERARGSIERATRDARRTFEAGLIGLPAKLQAEQRLLDVEQQSLDARIAQARSHIALFRATASGSDYQPPAP